MDVQAAKLIASFIGKWMTVSGPLGNVGAWHNNFSQVTFNRADPIVTPSLYIMFHDEAQVDRLSVFPPCPPRRLRCRFADRYTLLGVTWRNQKRIAPVTPGLSRRD
jgi:hypothetical protein